MSEHFQELGISGSEWHPEPEEGREAGRNQETKKSAGKIKSLAQKAGRGLALAGALAGVGGMQEAHAAPERPKTERVEKHELKDHSNEAKKLLEEAGLKNARVDYVPVKDSHKQVVAERYSVHLGDAKKGDHVIVMEFNLKAPFTSTDFLALVYHKIKSDEVVGKGALDPEFQQAAMAGTLKARISEKGKIAAEDAKVRERQAIEREKAFEAPAKRCREWVKDFGLAEQVDILPAETPSPGHEAVLVTDKGNPAINHLEISSKSKFDKDEFRLLLNKAMGDIAKAKRKK